MARKLTPQQRAFAVEVASGCTATEAAIRAGYSRKSAESAASRLVKHPQVAAEISRIQAKAEAQSLGSKAELLNMWWRAVVSAAEEGDRRALADLGERWLKARGEFVEKIEQTIEQTVVEFDWQPPTPAGEEPEDAR